MPVESLVSCFWATLPLPQLCICSLPYSLLTSQNSITELSDTTAFQENRRKAQEVLCRIVPPVSPFLWGSSIQASLERAVPPPSPSSELGIPFMSQADNNFPVLLLEYPNILRVVYILPTSMFSSFIAIVFRKPSIEQNAWLSGKFIVNRRPLISRTIIYIWMCLTYFVSCQDRLKCSVNSRCDYYEFLYWKKKPLYILGVKIVIIRQNRPGRLLWNKALSRIWGRNIVNPGAESMVKPWFQLIQRMRYAV